MLETEPMASKKAYPFDELLLTTREAARYLRLSHRTLEGFRVRGGGPIFIKAGSGRRSRVLYHPADINIWLEKRFSSTSEYEVWHAAPPKGGMSPAD